MTMTHTHTKTYTFTKFADPYKQCLWCGGWVDGALDSPGPVVVVPCEHDRGYRDLCPSWGPVDGCRCAEVLGSVPHPMRPGTPD